MTPVVSIENLNDHVDQEVTLQGWLYRKTGKGKLQFLQLRDGTGICQVVVFRGNVSDEDFAAGKELTQESCLRVTGRVKAEERAPGIPGGFELDATSLSIVQIAAPYPISPKEHGVEFLMENRHLWLRSNRQWAIMRVRATVISAIRDWLDEHGFQYSQAAPSGEPGRVPERDAGTFYRGECTVRPASKKGRPSRAAPGLYCFFSYFLRKRSIRPAVSINFCLPV